MNLRLCRLPYIEELTVEADPELYAPRKTEVALAEAGTGKIPKGKVVIHCNTPSYVGSHVTGYSNMVKGIVKYFAEPTLEKLRTVNIACGWVEPSDMREIKRICKVMGVETILFPDTSEVLDSPLEGKAQMYPKGGVTVSKLKMLGASSATLALGPTAAGDAARELDAKCKVPAHILDLPIGIKATDQFVNTLRKVARVSVPQELEDERGRLVDLMSDMQQYFYKKRVALWGDPDQLVSLTEFLADLSMKPVYIVTGTPGKKVVTRLQNVLADRVPEVKIAQGPCADMYQWIKKEGVDLLIGNTYGHYRYPP